MIANVMVVNIPSWVNQVRPWSRIQGGFFTFGSFAGGGSAEGWFNGSFPAVPLAERMVYSIVLSGSSDGRFSAILYDGYAAPEYNINYLILNSPVIGKADLGRPLLVWDLARGKISTPLPVLSLSLTLPSIAPAGRELKFPVTVRETAGVAGRVRLLSGATQIWEGDIRASEVITLEAASPMPYEALGITLTAEAYEPLGGKWQEVGKATALVQPAFPRVSLSAEGFPDTAQAGRPLAGTLLMANQGAEGAVRLLLGERVLLERDMGIGEEVTQPAQADMPYDDVTLRFSAQVLGRGKQWVETEGLVVGVKAGFPNLVVTDVKTPASLMPGRKGSATISAMNLGYPGDVDLDVRDAVRDETVSYGTRYLGSDETISITFTGEMPAAEAWTLLVIPRWTGRGRATVDGPSVGTAIPATRAMFQYSQEVGRRVTFLGGDEALYLTGLADAEAVEFSSGFKLPPELPAGPVPFVLNLGPQERQEFTFAKLRYFRFQSSSALAIVKDGQLVSREAKSSETGTPPAALLDAGLKLTTALSRSSSVLQ